MLSHRQKLEELVSDGGVDLLKEMILSDVRLNNALLTQISCIFKYKYEESERQKRDIGMEKACELWANKYALKFRQLYDEEKPFLSLYREIISG